MLRTYNKAPQINMGVILIVGSPGVGKHQLAKALVNVGGEISVGLRTATCLPLPADTSKTRPRIDFVVFIVDQTSRESFLVVKRSLLHVDPSFCFGKMCFILTQVNNAIFQSVSLDAMTQLAESYQSQLLCCDLQNSEERQYLAHQVLSKLHASSGHQNGVSSLLIDCTRVITSDDAGSLLT